MALTFGWVTKLSHKEAIARATGRASPAKPPMLAPTPVGTIKTEEYGLSHEEMFADT